MKKIFIIFFILSSIYINMSLTALVLKYDQETIIDRNNIEFNIYAFDEDSTFILVIIKSQYLLYYRYKCANLKEIKDDTFWHSSFIIEAQKEVCFLTIYTGYPFKAEGTILIHDISKDINYDYNSIEIKNKYKYNSYIQSYYKYPDIIYSLPTFKEDFKAKFNYSNTSISINDTKIIPSNPIRVCQNKNKKCRDNVNVYQFVKGKNYTIHIKFEELKIDSRKVFITTPFELLQANDSDKVDEGNNIKMKISLISLLLILIF